MSSLIIDCHIHMYAPEVVVDPRGWATAHREWEWLRCVAPAGRRSIQGWASIDKLLSDMDRAGVDKCVMLGWYWENQETCELQNGWYLDWARRHPDRLFAFAAVQPTAGERALDHLQRMLDAGFRGIGEMLPQAQHFGYEDECWRRVLEIAAARGVPVNLHVTDALVVPESAAPQTPLEDVVSLARKFPDVKFILAHWGGGLPFFEWNPSIKAAMRNVVYDTSASPLLYDAGVFQSVIDMVGARRVMWGTDYPLLVHPRETREPGFERSLREAVAAMPSAEQRGDVLGGNCLRLLRGEG
ncbi:MAG: amidohydrolase family protein [Opitutaceae bacterium]